MNNNSNNHNTHTDLTYANTHRHLPQLTKKLNNNNNNNNHNTHTDVQRTQTQTDTFRDSSKKMNNNNNHNTHTDMSYSVHKHRQTLSATHQKDVGGIQLEFVDGKVPIGGVLGDGDILPLLGKVAYPELDDVPYQAGRKFPGDGDVVGVGAHSPDADHLGCTGYTGQE